MPTHAARTNRHQWVTHQDLIKTGVTLERLRLLSKLGCFDVWPEAEQQRTERVLGAYADTLECINREPKTADEAAMTRARIDENLEVINDFLATEPSYLCEPEFSEVLLRSAVETSTQDVPTERQIGVAQ
jgi:hypothetical protein